MPIVIKDIRDIPREKIIALYEANEWSSAKKPDLLHKALIHSHSLLSAWDEDRLVGIANAISDGHLVVYFPHLLVLPEYQGKGVGRKIMEKMQDLYQGFHMQMLTADGEVVAFYEKMGFSRAGKTIPMWKYEGKEH